jgi:hypothetical protein
MKVVKYYSRALNRAESNYSITERECLAVIDSIKHWQDFLLMNKVYIITDSRPLKWLLSLKDPSFRLARWSLILGDCQLEIIHRAGKNHSNVGALSRLINVNQTNTENEIAPPPIYTPVFTRHMIQQEQQKDDHIQKIIKQIKENNTDIGPYV